MCGFAGILTRRPQEREHLSEIAIEMSDCIVHRGPDDSGVWVDTAVGIALGFRRLSIIDLSPLGHQPMKSSSGRFVMVFNGEVYNYRELRAELLGRGHTFRGSSDSEVMLAAFERWGVEASLRRFIGMFAIALWDCQKRELHLVRDRVGKKPLFVHATSSRVVFGSELKSLLRTGLDSSEIDQVALHGYLTFLYAPAPRSILAQVKKVLPGHFLTFSENFSAPRDTEYWSLTTVANDAIAARRRKPDGEVLAEFQSLLSAAVQQRMYADVPLGSLLSGGIDSSLITAVMQASSQVPVRTFCIGFDVQANDEREFARRIANHLGTEHQEMVVSGSDALSIVERLPDIADEPLADPSIIPTLLVCKLARENVTVVLTGDGGDELFAGYNRQAMALNLKSLIDMPVAARRMLSILVAGPGRHAAGAIELAMQNLHRSKTRPKVTSARLAKLAAAISGADLANAYRTLLSVWYTSPLLHTPETAANDPVLSAFESVQSDDPLDQILLADQSSYLPDDLLAKLDRTSMAVSLEARSPLLDHRVVEYSWGLGSDFKLRSGESKWLMRALLRTYVPPELFERPKTGFTVPLSAWLRGPLNEWASDLLEDATRGNATYFKKGEVQKAWKSHSNGQDEMALPLWTIIQFQAWRNRWSI